jgi:CRISPR-associated protein Cmr2
MKYLNIIKNELEDMKIEGENYKDLSGNSLYLWKHPVTNIYRGIQESEAGKIREEALNRLRDEIIEFQGKNRLETLKGISEKLYSIYSDPYSNPSLATWLSLPSDTRHGKNTIRLSDHLIVTSAITSALVLQSLYEGKTPSEITGLGELDLSGKEVLYISRIGAMLHDIGKHPPVGHTERGKESIKNLLEGLLESNLIEAISEIALRHHTSWRYKERDILPETLLEEIIAHADTAASGADRPTDIPIEEINKGFSKLGNEYNFDKKLEWMMSIRDFERNFTHSPPLALISADTDRIKSYVFESPKLPDIRGASQILVELNEKEVRDKLWKEFMLPPECLLYAAGGGFLILSPIYLAEKIRSFIEETYLKHTLSGTISTAFKEIGLLEIQIGIVPKLGSFETLYSALKEGKFKPHLVDSYLSPLNKNEEEEFRKIQNKDIEKAYYHNRYIKTKVFGELVGKLAVELRKAKDEKSRYPFFETVPFERQCEVCEVKPASKLVPIEDETQWICEVCCRKRKEGRREKFESYERFLQYDQAYSSRFKNVLPPQSLDEIGKASKGRANNYIGVILLDGDGIGGFLQRLSTPSAYRTFSQKLLKATHEAVYKGLYLTEPVELEDKLGNRKTIAPFEIVLLGGDDLFLIVRGDAAIPIAFKIASNFQEYFHNELTMSGSVVIAKSHTPIYNLRLLAEELQGSAKSFKKKNKKEEGVIDFAIITGSGTSAISEESFKKAYKIDDGSDSLHLTLRPYPLSFLKEILNIAYCLKKDGFPKTQLNNLQTSLSLGNRLRSLNYYHYQWARLDESKRELFNGIEKKIRKLYGNLEGPWIKESIEGKVSYKTIWSDIAEVFDFCDREILEKALQSGEQ